VDTVRLKRLDVLVFIEHGTRRMHYTMARPHQGIAQHVPDEEPDAPRANATDINTQQVHRKPVLGGLINEYTRAA
jgi:hypothetical protein